MKKPLCSKLMIALPLLGVLAAGRANAATVVVTPGEQNTASGEFQCTPAGAGCPGGGKWPYYPELLQQALGNTYTVKNTGDGGAIMGCDDASKAFAGGNSFCASGKYTTSSNPPPDIVIIGPFGEHDQRIFAGASTANFTTFYTVAAFQAAYEGMIAKYTALKPTVKFVMMLPVDVPFNSGALPAGKNIVKDVMLTAAKNAAMAHNIPIADTYTAITAAMYPVNDGQTNAAGQMKMAQLVEAALDERRQRRHGRRRHRRRRGSGGGGSGGATAGSGGAAGSGGLDRRGRLLHRRGRLLHRRGRLFDRRRRLGLGRGRLFDRRGRLFDRRRRLLDRRRRLLDWRCRLLDWRRRLDGRPIRQGQQRRLRDRLVRQGRARWGSCSSASS